MKRIKYLILLMVLLIIPNLVNADTSNVVISCSPSTVTVGGSTTCNITGNTDLSINGVSLTLSLGEDTTYTFTKASIWSGDGEGGSIGLYTDETVTGAFNIGTLVVNFGDNHETGSATILLSNIKFGNDDTLTNLSDTSTTITVNGGSSQEPTGLQSLSITNGTLSPAFTVDGTGYTVMLDSASTTTFGINAVPANSNETITYVSEGTTISNPSNITFVPNNGSMAITITVGSKEYRLTVTKPTEAASNELSSLIIDGVHVNLQTGKYDYEVTLSSTKNYQVNATLKDTEHFKISNLNLPTSMSGSSFAIAIEPKDTSSSLKGVTYRISVKTSGTPSGNGGTSGGSGSNSSGNPQTGEAALIMAAILFLSFGISMYLYKKNLQNYN
ncbi:MAG: hypothetical protein IKI04_02895 [Bacilli bacterium]|nr:hypothetical protein [Bacilli bacterium]